MEKVERLGNNFFVLLFCFLENERVARGNVDKKLAAAFSTSHTVAQTVLNVLFYFRRTSVGGENENIHPLCM